MKGRVFNVVCNLLGLIALCCQGVGLWGKGWQVTKFELEMLKWPPAMQQIIPFPVPPMNISVTVSKGIWSVDFAYGFAMLEEEFAFTVNVQAFQALIRIIEKFEKQNMTPPRITSPTVRSNASSTTINQAMTPFMETFGKSLTKLHALAAIAIISGFLGAAMFALCFRFNSKNTGFKRVVFCIICWTLSAILVIVAVIIGLQDRTCLKTKYLADINNKTGGQPFDSTIMNNTHVSLLFPWATFMSGIGASCSVLVAGILMLQLCMKPNSLSEKGTIQITHQFKDNKFRLLDGEDSS